MSIQMVDARPLFQEGRLRDYLDNQRESVQRAVRGVPRKEIIQADLEALSDKLYDDLRIDVPELPEEQQLDNRVRKSEPTDTKVDVSDDWSRDVQDQTYPMNGTKITFTVPFDGSREIFRYRPGFGRSLPRVSKVNSDVLKFMYKWPHDSGSVENANERFRKDLKQVREFLRSVREQVQEEFNSSLSEKIKIQLQQRKESVSEEQSAAESLPYELERRADAPKTYTAPIERISTDPQPEDRDSGRGSNWIIKDEKYEQILTVLKNMAWVMERSPSAFEGMEEEDLRTHFLVQLNGQFTGPATGETFNTKGKADIYLPFKGRAVFIAECKFWDGSKTLREAVDQLLDHTSWRDTKTAVVVFNRNKDTSNVLDQVPEVIEQHDNHLRTADYGAESDFRFVLHQEGDPKREITVTVMVFDVPTS